MSKLDRLPLTAERFDEVMQVADRHGLGRPIWGLPHIARMLGVSVDTVRRWALDPDIPIYRPKGSKSYFAFKSELLEWLRGGKDQRNPTTF